MKIHVDGVLLEQEQATLGDGLRAGADHAEATGRVVISAELDGRALNDEELSSLRDTPDGSDLVIGTADPRELARAAAGQAIEALDVAKELQSEVADAVDRGELDAAMPKIGQAMDAWGAARNVVEYGSTLLSVDLAQTTFGEISGGEAIERLTNTLTELKQALADSDTSALSDILRDDLSELADIWSSMLDFLRNVECSNG